MSRGKSAVVALVIFIAIIAGILLVLHFLGYLLVAVALLGLFSVIGIILLIVLIGVAMLFLVPYYMLRKKPVVQEYGSYSIDSVQGKEDWENKG